MVNDLSVGGYYVFVKCNLNQQEKIQTFVNTLHTPIKTKQSIFKKFKEFLL